LSASAAVGERDDRAAANDLEDDMRISLGCAAVFMLLLGAPRSAVADPITIRLDRFISVSADVATVGDEVESEVVQSDADVLFRTTTVSLGPNSATGTGSLTSSLSNDSQLFSGTGHFNGTAEISLSGNRTNAGAASQVIVTWEFRLDQPHSFNFDSRLITSSDDIRVSYRIGLLEVRSASLFDTVFSDENLGIREATLGHHGRLDSGFYLFSFLTSTGLFVSQGMESGSMDFDLNLGLSPAAPTPEPGTMGLVGCGLLAVVTAFRKRKQCV
jgi:hypothetical protein